MKSIGIVLLAMGLASLAFAGGQNTYGVPEVSPATGIVAFTFLAGLALVIHSRRKKQPTEVR